MKRILKNVLVYLLILQINHLAQNCDKNEIVLNYDFSINSNQDLKKVNYEELNHKFNFFLRDVVIDKNEKVYVSDVNQKKILVFQQNGDLDFEINLAEDVSKKDFNRIKLILDSSNNLYVVLLRGEFYYDMRKFKEGKINQNFKIEKSFPQERIISLYTNCNRLFILTSPSAIDPRYYETGNVFVYDKNGSFLARTNYHITYDNKIVYKRKSSLNEFICEIFRNDNPREIKRIEDFKKISEITIKYNKPGRNRPLEDKWRYVGIDKTNNIYFANNLKILKYNSTGLLIETIPFSQNSIFGQNIISNINSIRISPNGGIYIHGVKSNLKDFAKSTDYSINEIYPVILKVY